MIKYHTRTHSRCFYVALRKSLNFQAFWLRSLCKLLALWHRRQIDFSLPVISCSSHRSTWPSSKRLKIASLQSTVAAVRAKWSDLIWTPRTTDVVFCVEKVDFFRPLLRCHSIEFKQQMFTFLFATKHISVHQRIRSAEHIWTWSLAFFMRPSNLIYIFVISHKHNFQRFSINFPIKYL